MYLLICLFSSSLFLTILSVGSSLFTDRSGALCLFLSFFLYSSVLTTLFPFRCYFCLSFSSPFIISTDLCKPTQCPRPAQSVTTFSPVFFFFFFFFIFFLFLSFFFFSFFLCFFYFFLSTTSPNFVSL